MTAEEYVDTGVQAQGQDGNDGVSPTITVTDITGGHRISITDATGTTAFDVMDGAKGDDGVSPTVSIQDITNGHRIIITDKTGSHSFDVLNGIDGDDGYSPTVTVTEITGGHRVTITDAQGAHTFDVMDGSGSSITVDPVYARYENCNARKFRFGDNDTGGTVCHAYFYNCKAAFILIEVGTVHDQYFYIHGEGINDVMVKCPTGYVYETGDTLRFYDDNISAGKAVKIVNLYDSRQNNLVVTSSLVDIYGVSIGTIGDDTVIQTRGYINSNTLGLTGLSVGDYLTVDASGTVVSGGTAANAIAVVKMVDNDGVAYAKLMI